jgi:hypothetical protein
VRARTLIATAAAVAAAAGSSAGTPSLPDNVTEIPPVADVRPTRPTGPPLRRTHDLLTLFSAGDGEWQAGHSSAPDVGIALPWNVAPGRERATRLVTWPGLREGHDEEGMLAIVLRDGERWCSAPLELDAGSRLRFEAVALEGRPRLEVALGSGGAARRLLALDGAAGRPLETGSQSELPLPAAPASLCLASHGGTVAFGEGRILAPDMEPGRLPRWVVLFVFDSFRGDLLTSDTAARLVPGLLKLAAGARVFRQALSVGSHTLAAMNALQTGRDPMRIDPRSPLFIRWGALPYASEEVVLSRPNLPLWLRLGDLGYHTVLFGNNAYLRGSHAFARYSLQGHTALGTVDNVARMGPLLSRYGDERVATLVWVSAAHTLSLTPRRLYEALGCAALGGLAEERCRYDARARHADEALVAFEQGLERAGLAEGTLQAVFADHAEQFDDGTPVELREGATWKRADEAHGSTTDWSALHVPLVLKGPGVPAGQWNGRVSTLDVVPTIEMLLGLPGLGALDGRPLPLGAPRPSREERRFVSYGFCGHSDLTGDERMVWWDAACGERRPLDPAAATGLRSELWRGRQTVATDRAPSAALIAAQVAHARWIGDRLPGDALILDCAGLGPGRRTLSIRVPDGRIVDWGPSGTGHGFGSLRSRLLDEQRLEVELDGYAGRYAVVTRPARATLVIDHAAVADPPVALVGRRQLPMHVWGRPLDPLRLADVLVASQVPPLRPTDVPVLRLWWQSVSGSGRRETGAVLGPMDQVLRAWGYIR